MATLATNVSFQCLGLDGKPLAGGKVYTYEAGTTTPKSTYTTMAGDVPNLNPVILDQNGKAKIFLGDGAYRMRILDSNDALIDDIDQISRYVTQSEFAAFQQTVQDGVAELDQVREQIDVFVSTSIGNQKGYANGIVPLDENVKIDPIYIPELINTPLVPQATETQVGVAKIATTAIAQAGTNDTDIITAKKLKNTLGASKNALAGTVNFNGTGTVSIRSQLNVSSITDLGVGTYKINMTTAMPNASYPVFASVADRSSESRYIGIEVKAQTVNSITVYVFATGTGGAIDVDFISVGWTP